MTIKEQLIAEINHFPEELLDEALDFLLFIKTRYTAEITDEITIEEQQSIAASQEAYRLGDYVTIEQYETSKLWIIRL